MLCLAQTTTNSFSRHLRTLYRYSKSLGVDSTYSTHIHTHPPPIPCNNPIFVEICSTSPGSLRGPNAVDGKNKNLPHAPKKSLVALPYILKNCTESIDISNHSSCKENLFFTLRKIKHPEIQF